MSPSESFAALFDDSTSRYTVVDLAARAVVDSGSCASFAWIGHGDVYGVQSPDAATSGEETVTNRRNRRRRRGSLEIFGMKKKMEDSNDDDHKKAPLATVELKQITNNDNDENRNGQTNGDSGDSGGRKIVSLGQVSTRGTPTRLFGGPLLMITSSLGTAQFYSTAGGLRSLGPPFPVPDAVSWNETNTVLAITVADRVFFYSKSSGKVGLSLLCVARHTPGATGPEVHHAAFVGDVLVVTTAETVQMIVPHRGSADVFVLGHVRGEAADDFEVDLFGRGGGGEEGEEGKEGSGKKKNKWRVVKKQLRFSYPTVLDLSGTALVVFYSGSETTDRIEITSPALRAAVLFRCGERDLAETIAREEGVRAPGGAGGGREGGEEEERDREVYEFFERCRGEL